MPRTHSIIAVGTRHPRLNPSLQEEPGKRHNPLIKPSAQRLLRHIRNLPHVTQHTDYFYPLPFVLHDCMRSWAPNQKGALFSTLSGKIHERGGLGIGKCLNSKGPRT